MFNKFNQITKYIIISSNLFLISQNQATSYHTIFGDFEIEDKIIQTILNTDAMKRLEHIDQSGTPVYFGHFPKYTRLSHCLGVYDLLRRYNVPINEQIAGLLHDVSHTVFSHVTDTVFKNFSAEIAYQDDIHEWFMTKMRIDKVLEQEGINFKDIVVHGNDFPALEQNLPLMCADRIEYNLHTGLILGLITESEIHKLIIALKYENNKWYFTDIESAQKLGNLSLSLTENIYGSSWNYVLYYWSAEMLKRAIELELITLDQIHFGQDKDIMKILRNSSDDEIKLLLEKCTHYQKYYKVVSDENFDKYIHPKFRGIDPLILHKGKLVNLSILDQHFFDNYNRVKNLMTQGFKIKFIE